MHADSSQRPRRNMRKRAHEHVHFGYMAEGKETKGERVRRKEKPIRSNGEVRKNVFVECVLTSIHVKKR